MFGHKKLLTEGAQGQGIITEMTMNHARNAPDAVRDFQISFQFKFEDGSVAKSQLQMTQWDWRDEFEASVFGWLENYLQPGEPVPVRYDPADHSKLVLDLPALKATLGPKVQERDAASEAALADRIAQAEGHMSGSATPEAAIDPEQIRARLMAQAEVSDAPAFVVTETGVAPVGGAPAQQPTDFADALNKLADLRDRGLLTPAEFEAQKQKLLGA